MNITPIANVSVYKFTHLVALPRLRKQLLIQGQALQLKGLILLSHEGINCALAGEPAHIKKFITALNQDARFNTLDINESFSTKMPFRRLRIKLKKEIVALKNPTINPMQLTGKYLPPSKLKAWLDENKDFVLLDTRNTYEATIGTFSKAKTLPIVRFSEFTKAVEQINLPKNKPLVMFCTGGIRCEKASAVMLKAGYENVYQLQGGILKYFEHYNNSHYQGNCFVFDARTAITPHFEETGLTQCPRCKNFLDLEAQQHWQFSAWKCCQFCYEARDLQL